MSIRLRSLGQWLVACSLLGSASSVVAQPAPAAPTRTAEEITMLAQQYCGGCHNVPSPNILPKRSWPALIRTMADIGKQRTGREYIPADVLRDITALYYGSSPTELPTLPFDEVASPGRTFVRRELAALSTNPTILNISATKLRARSVRPERRGPVRIVAFTGHMLNRLKCSNASRFASETMKRTSPSLWGQSNGRAIWSGPCFTAGFSAAGPPAAAVAAVLPKPATAAMRVLPPAAAAEPAAEASPAACRYRSEF